jgi:hypothetical protein
LASPALGRDPPASEPSSAQNGGSPTARLPEDLSDSLHLSRYLSNLSLGWDEKKRRTRKKKKKKGQEKKKKSLKNFNKKLWACAAALRVPHAPFWEKTTLRFFPKQLQIGAIKIKRF